MRNSKPPEDNVNAESDLIHDQTAKNIFECVNVR